MELLPRIPSPCSSGRPSNGSKSPEFEFWMVRNPSFPQPNLLSADELFSGGVILPLHNLHLSNLPSHQDPPESSGSGQAQKPDTESADLTVAPALTSSKRWRDIFKKSDGEDRSSKEKGNNIKEKKREKKNSGGGGSGNGMSAAELNINIWPFSRSRSAGNSGIRPRPAAATRKVSSAPCSRSNSAGESKSRKWPSSPGRAAGVHLGRSSPVWQVRRSAVPGGGGRKVKGAEKGVKKVGNEGHRSIPAASGRGVGEVKARVLSLNVPMCIGYRNHLSCRSDENSAVSIAAVAATGGGGGQSGGGVVSGEGVRGSNFFNIKGLFSKKVY